MMKGSTALYGVMGSPVRHSLSPLIHSHWMKAHKLDAAYIPLAVQSQDLEQAVQLLPRIGFKGWNVTLPHKEDILPHLDDLSARARAIGAVNLVSVQDGRLYGDNTDGQGFLRDIERLDRRPRHCVVLGAGGAAKAIVHACLSHPSLERLHLLNRTPLRADHLAQSLADHRIKTGDFQDLQRAIAGADLIVNTTSLGMVGHGDSISLPHTGLDDNALVYDVIYNPYETGLLKAAKAAGFHTLNGLGMLIEQARPSFETWFGILPDRDKTLETILYSALSAYNP